MRKLAGYSLTGDTREQLVPVLYGAGCNGKDTLIKPVQRIAGEHAQPASIDSFMAVRNRGVRNDLAGLHRARLVVASESAEGRKLDEATVKSVSGGNSIAARFLYGEFFEFTPMFKVWLITNHRPRVEGDDDAIWRRLRLIPFSVSFLGREDRDLDGKLETELPGIFAWAVRGCLEWQTDGLGLPAAVEEATREYRADEEACSGHSSPSAASSKATLSGRSSGPRMSSSAPTWASGLSLRASSESVCRSAASGAQRATARTSTWESGCDGERETRHRSRVSERLSVSKGAVFVGDERD